MVHMEIPFVITPEMVKRTECRDAYQDNKLGYLVNMEILLHLRLGWSGLARSRWTAQKTSILDSK